MEVWKNAVLGYIGGMLYIGLELIWRQWSHGSMFLVGGICFVLIGNIDRFAPRTPMLMQMVVGAILVTSVELVSGLIINVALGLRVWDYSAMPYNLWGQICISYFFLWILVSAAAIWLEDLLRQKLFGEDRIRLNWI